MNARLLLGCVAAALGAAEPPGVESTEVRVPTLRGEVTVRVQTRANGGLAGEPWFVLHLGTARADSLAGGAVGVPAAVVVELGHRAASFDLPAHGGRIDARGPGIAGLRNLVLAGDDPFLRVIDEGRAVIDECLRRGWAAPGRIAVCGVSRGAYFAARLAAADERVAAIALLAPVTDWRELREFAEAREHPGVAALALTNFAAPLAGRRLYIAIGNADDRVGTAACVRFVHAVMEAARTRGVAAEGLRFQVADDSPGHGLANHWRQEGARFLVQMPQREAR